MTKAKKPEELFEESRQQFREAHAEGLQKIREHDVAGLGAAIDKERSAIAKAASSIGSVSSVSRAADAHASPRDAAAPANEREGLAVEHVRLREQVDALEREHRQLELHPWDFEGHREHRARLKAQIAALRTHLQRLRHEPDGG